MKFPVFLAASIIYLLAASCAQSPQCPFQRTSDARSLEKTAPQGISCGSRPIRSCGKLNHCYIHLLRMDRTLVNYVGGNDDVMQNVKVTLSPNPPRLSSNITITIDATVSEFL